MNCKLLQPFSSLRSEWVSILQSVVADCQKGKIVSLYSHENRVFGNIWQFNCYGFVAHLLQKYHPQAHQASVQFMFVNQDRIPVSFDHIPCPFHYSAFFTSLVHDKNPHWSYVPDMRDLRPGDFIVYLPFAFTPQEITGIGRKRTGTHVMMVEEMHSSTSNEVSLTVIDCTRFRHCWEDQRIQGGIGRSPLTIRKTQEGKHSLHWGSREKSWEKELFFGRLN